MLQYHFQIGFPSFVLDGFTALGANVPQYATGICNACFQHSRTLQLRLLLNIKPLQSGWSSPGNHMYFARHPNTISLRALGSRGSTPRHGDTFLELKSLTGTVVLVFATRSCPNADYGTYQDGTIKLQTCHV